MSKTKEKIQDLKQNKDAIILAHNYQRQEVQKIADYVGDSLGLSREASNLENEIIVFCGVDFMAESAAILSPNKKILLPNKQAKCPMAGMVTAEELQKIKKENPDAATVAYVNTTAEIKALSDICCTSSNAVNVVNSLEEDKIIFVPDKNLAKYVDTRVDKEVIPWDGYCPTHDRITKKEVREAKENAPEAIVTAHPECRMEVLEEADYISSTGGMIELAKESEEKKFLVGTEIDLVNRLDRENEEKDFAVLSPSAICPNMKKITIENTYKSLKKREIRNKYRRKNSEKSQGITRKNARGWIN